MAFPTLTSAPVYPITENRADATIRSETEAGYTLARPRFTRSRRNFAVNYRNISPADKELIVSHFDTVGGSTIFTWTNPVDSTAYSVRYAKPPVVTQRIPNVFDVDLELAQV